MCLVSVCVADQVVIYVMDENSNDFVEMIIAGDNLTISGKEECRGDSVKYLYTNLTNMEKVIHISGFLEN